MFFKKSVQKQPKKIEAIEDEEALIKVAKKMDKQNNKLKSKEK